STQAELGGSEYLRLRGGTAPVPSVDPLGLQASMDHLLRAIRAGTVAAAHDLSHGGLAVAAAEMCLGGDIGADLKTTAMDPMRWDVQLFSESNGRWLVEVTKDRYEAFTHLMEGIPTTYLGTTGGRSLHLARGRPGTIFAARLRSRLSKDLVGFVKAGKPVFGVCNGFQVLVEAGLLPALGGVMTDEPEAVLGTNDSSHYECRPSLLRMENGGSCA